MNTNSPEWLILFEEAAISKYPLPGSCSNPCMAGGYHRVGLVPVYSVLDGALPGDSCMEICLECGERVKRTDEVTGETYYRNGFVPRDQPSSLGATETNTNQKEQVTK
ncbi:MAG: hypothetical protein U9Q82_10060 [Chloroflexota bacterium]|nr:hypothetical protein [Chloroflexota bacterium]